MSSGCRMNKNCGCMRCQKQKSLYHRTLYPIDLNQSVTEFNRDLISIVDFQRNPYFGITSDQQLSELNRRVRCSEHKRNGHHHHHKKDNRRHVNLWYHNNSADFGPDSLYQTPYIGSRNMYPNQHDHGVGVPYYTSKYQPFP
jgi:hypothetical protein